MLLGLLFPAQVFPGGPRGGGGPRRHLLHNRVEARPLVAELVERLLRTPALEERFVVQTPPLERQRTFSGQQLREGALIRVELLRRAKAETNRPKRTPLDEE